MNTNKLFSIALIAGSLLATNAVAFDYKKAINLAGKQRMLTQKMSKEALLVALDIDKDTNLGNLQKTRNLFDKTLNGLKDGDSDLGLDATKKPKIKKQLDKVMGLWGPFDKVVSEVAGAGAASKDNVSAIAAQNLPLLKEMNKAVKFYEADAAGSGTNPALAKAINLAGRQRMLTQKMSKEFFLSSYGHEADKNKASLAETITLFDTTLTGLIKGDASMGLSAAPNAEIKGQLEKVQGMWKEFRAALEGGDKSGVASKNLPLLKEMNAAVQMFEKL